MNNKISFNLPAEKYTKVSQSFCDARKWHFVTCCSLVACVWEDDKL